VVAQRAQGQRVEVVRSGAVLGGTVPDAIAGNDAAVEFDLPVKRSDWVRINLRDSTGLTVLTNPIYFR
jgi:hypothetical protein